MISEPNSKQEFEHISSILHESKLVVFATDQDARIYYTVKQDGFEDTALDPSGTNHTGWETWKILDLPGAFYSETGHPVAEIEDISVIEKEQQNNAFTDDADKYIIRSRYTTHNHTARAPVQLISGLGHLYVFRQLCVPAIARW